MVYEHRGCANILQDEVHARLRQLQPKHGVRERTVAGGFSVETDVSGAHIYVLGRKGSLCHM